MFLPGTKVMMLNSSVKSSSTGPRVGSVGYYVGGGGFRGLKGGLFDRQRTIASGIKINFVRYGFEKTQRSEIKSVIALVPIKYDEPHRRRFKKLSEKTIKNFAPEEYHNVVGSFTETPASRVCFGHMAPIKTDLTNVSKREWINWATAILLNYRISNVLNSMSTAFGSQYVKGKVPLTDRWYEKLTDMSDDRRYRQRELEILSSTANGRRVATTAIRTVASIASRYSSKQITDKCTNELSRGRLRFRKGDGSNNSRMSHLVRKSLFTPIFNRISDILSTCDFRDVANFSNNMIQYKNIAESLAERMESEHQE